MFGKSCVYGPLNSRRLGKSLCVNLLTEKACPQDCIYCEVGKTTLLTMERRVFVPEEVVFEQLDKVLSEGREIDHITFSGYGEPTLSASIGKVAEYIKKNHPRYPLVLLTNGMLLGDEAVQREISCVDLVIPSLDGSCEAEFQAVNRPVKDFSFDRFISGMQSFMKQRTCRVHLELFVVPGINDSMESIRRFREIVAALNVDLVQLNHLDRAGTEDHVRVPDMETLSLFARELEKAAPVEII